MSSERQQKIDRIMKRMRARLEQEWPEGETDPTGVEEIVLRIEREVLREVTEELLREQSQRREGNRSACGCGKEARYRKASPVEIVTLFGRVRVLRPYYYCAACQTGSCPLDQAWGLGPGNTTPGVQDLVGVLAAFGAYPQVPALLRRVRPQVHLGVKTIELIARYLGERLTEEPLPRCDPATRSLAALVDGVIVPMRGGGKEARVGVVYEPHFNSGRTPAACEELRKEYFATLESRDTLVATVCARVEARRPTPTTRVAALGDGADWIWDGFAKHLPHRVEILDFYHVSERLAKLGAAMHPEQPLLGQRWREEQERDLQLLGPGRLLERLEAWAPASASAQQVREEQLRYFRTHRERMQYPQYLREGFPIGSGAVEGACKHGVSDRFRGTGMRWKSKTAEPLLHLRAGLLTDPNRDLRPYAGAA